jgi:hypothetical protein
MRWSVSYRKYFFRSWLLAQGIAFAFIIAIEWILPPGDWNLISGVLMLALSFPISIPIMAATADLFSRLGVEQPAFVSLFTWLLCLLGGLLQFCAVRRLLELYRRR